MKGLILADARCLESFYSVIVFVLACRKKGLTLADARCLTEFLMDLMIYIGDGLYLGDHTKSFGSKD